MRRIKQVALTTASAARIRQVGWLAVWVLASARLLAADPAQLELEGRFTNTIRPFIDTYCIDCHSGEKPKADLDLSPCSTLGEVARAPLHWELVLEKLQAAEMPPEKAKRHPSSELRQRIVLWIHLSLMDRMGVSLPCFGDADTRLADL